MNNLGVLYEKGYGVEQDYEKALEYYNAAMEAGNAYGYLSLGAVYEKGHGVEQDYEKAAEWYQKALDAGYEPDDEDQKHLIEVLGEDYVAIK